MLAAAGKGGKSPLFAALARMSVTSTLSTWLLSTFWWVSAQEPTGWSTSSESGDPGAPRRSLKKRFGTARRAFSPSLIRIDELAGRPGSLGSTLAQKSCTWTEMRGEDEQRHARVPLQRPASRHLYSIVQKPAKVFCHHIYKSKGAPGGPSAMGVRANGEVQLRPGWGSIRE